MSLVRRTRCCGVASKSTRKTTIHWRKHPTDCEPNDSGLVFVAHAANGMEMHRRFGVLFEGLSEGQDEIVDGSGGRQNVVTPHLLKNVLSADHLTFSANQQLQQHGFRFDNLRVCPSWPVAVYASKSMLPVPTFACFMVVQASDGDCAINRSSLSKSSSTRKGFPK